MGKSLLPARRARCAPVSVIAIYVLTSVCANAQTNTFQVSGGEPWIDVTGQGAYLDAQTLCNASNSTTMSPYTISLPIGYSFSGAFVGEEMWVQGSPPLSLVPETPLAVGTVTGVGVGANSVTFMATSGSVPMASGLCVTWGHDDVYALQASLNLLMAAPFNGVGGEIKIPHGKTGQMMVGQQQAMLTSNDTSTTNYVVVLSVATPSSVWPSNVFQTAAGANITIVCTGSTGNVWNGTGNTATESVTGWNPSTGQIAFNVPNTATTPTFCSAGTVTETGVYAPTQTAYVIEAENKTGAAPASNSGVELLGGFGGGFIMNIGQRGANLNPAPRIQGLQFNDMSQTGAGAGGLLCTQCLNGEFTDLSFVSFNGKTSYFEHNPIHAVVHRNLGGRSAALLRGTD